MRKFLTTLFLSLCISTTCHAQMKNLQKIRIDDFSGGMVSNTLADLLEPKQSASMVNISLEQRGKLKKRKGQALFVKDVDEPNSTQSVFRGLGRFDPDANTSYLVVASGTNVIRAESASSDWTLASPTSILTSGQDTEFVQANDLFFVLNGYDSTGFYNGSKFNTGGSYPSSPPSATTGAWLRNYLFLAGATIHNDWIYFSNNLDPTTFDVTDIVPISTGDGQKIQRILPFRLNELITYKARSIFVLDITGVFDDAEWTVQPISTVIGTIAPRSVVNLGNDQWFLSSEPIAVRSLARTSFDKILVNVVSSEIQDIFDGTNAFGFNINKTHVSKSAAILFDNKYILAIPTGTSTINNTVLVYDFKWNAWYLIKGWRPAAWIEFDNRLFYIDANDGRVLECFTGTTGDFANDSGFINSASVPSVGIEWVVQTRALTFDSQNSPGGIENYKQAQQIEVAFDPTGDHDVTVYYNDDNSGWERLGTVNLAGLSATLPITLPTILSNSGVAREMFPTQSQGEFRKVQIMLENNASQETVTLQRITNFSQVKPWRPE